MKAALLIPVIALMAGSQAAPRASSTGKKIPQGAHVATFYVN